jgi:chitodextrinase
MPNILQTYGGVASAVAMTPQLVTTGGVNAPPSPVSDLTPTNVTQTSARLTWGPATDSDGSVTGYRVYEVVGGVDTLRATVTVLFYDIIGRTQGTAYTYRVTAVDNDGAESAPSTAGFTTLSTDTTPPSTPSSLTISGVTSTQFTATWTASTDAGSGLDHYDLFSTDLVLFTQPPAGTLTHTFTGLTAGTTYQMRVRGVDAAGNIGGQAAASVTTTASADTQAPTWGAAQLLASNITSSSVTLTWGAAIDNVAVTHYEIELDFFGTWVSQGTRLEGNRQMVISSGLAADTDYTFAATAIDAAGNRSARQLRFIHTDPAPDTTDPTPPSGLNFTNVTNAQIRVNWTPGTDTGGSGLAGHVVYQVAGGVATQLGTTVPAGTNTKLVTGLSAGTSYTFRVRSIDGAGNLSTPANQTQGTTSTSGGGGSSNPFDREFGIVTANTGSVDQLNEVADAVNRVSGALKANPKLTMWRIGIEWNNMATGDTYDVSPHRLGLINAARNQGGKVLLGCNYTHIDYVRTINLGPATATAGNQYIQLQNAVPSGPTGGGGKFGQLPLGLRLSGGGWSTAFPMTGDAVMIADDASDSDASDPNANFSSDRKRVNLIRGFHTGQVPSGARQPVGTRYTLPGSGTGDLIVGVRSSGDKVDKMTPVCSATNDNATRIAELEPYGRFVAGLLQRIASETQVAVANSVAAVEMSNEVNHFLGVRPWADPALWYRNMCHAYCAVKLVAPSIFVVAPGPGDNNGSFAHMPEPVRWFRLLHDQQQTVQPNYFSNLKTACGVSSPGPMPFDWCSVHAYSQKPNQVVTSGDSVMDGIAHIYNEFNGAYPIMPTEQGPSWNGVGATPVGNAFGGSWPLSAAGTGDWWQYVIDLTHGNIRWPHTPFVGTAGTTLSATSGVTLAERRAAARIIFRPWMHFSLQTPSGGEEGNTKGMYSDSTLASKKFTLATGNGDILDMMRAYS